jgi:hypothetical protein
MADLSVSDLVQRVRDLLGDHPYETTSTTTTTSTTVAVVDGTRWEEGAIGEWQTGTVGYEQFYVQSVAANNLTVVRGYDGTTAETHTSGDRVLRIDSESFAGRKIQQAINQAVLELWPYVWKTGTVSLTYAPTTTKWYDLNAATVGIVKVLQQKSTTIPDYGRFGFTTELGGRPYVVRFGLPAAIAASTKGISFPGGVYDSRDPGANSIIVTDKRIITGTTDIPDSSVLPVAEAVTFGAVARLLKAKEIARVVFGAPLEAVQTSSTGVRLQTAAYYDDQFRRRLETLDYRLRQLHDPDRAMWNAS